MESAPGIRWDDLPALRERAADLLGGGPLPAGTLAEGLFGLRRAPAGLLSRLVREVLAPDPRFDRRQDRWRLRDGEATYGSVPLSEVDFVVVDLETTGGSPGFGDRITELAAVRVRGGRVVDQFETLVNPERPIPRSVTALTNITHDMVAAAPRFSELADTVRQRLAGAVFVAHNVDFDWRFLRAEFARCRGVRLWGQRICTLRLARLLHPELPRRSLRALTRFYDIRLEVWHRAGPDARATAEVFCRFLDRLCDDGVGDWAALERYLGGPAPNGSLHDAPGSSAARS